MPNQTPDRVAIVTGASGGIGTEIARRLARSGIATVVNYARNADEAARVVGAIEGEGGRAVAARADLTDRQGASALFDAAEQAFGGVDILVNNAGVITKSSAITEVADADFDAQVAINLAGAFRGMREGARRLRDGGRIVNLSSCVVGLYQPGNAVYAATKAAVEAMTHVAAKELAGRGITVNAVAPGPVDTPFFHAGKTEEQVRAIAGMNPFKRLGTPEDVAGVVAFLVGPEGGWINGQVIRANGGVI